MLKDKKIELSIVNTFDAMKEYTKHMNIKMDIRHTGECNGEQLAQFYKDSLVPISAEMRIVLEQDGRELLQTSGVARSWKRGKMIHELETKDDSYILECAKRLQNERQNNDYIYVMRVIGEVLGNSDEYLNDAWIEYRIRSLIDAGQLEYEGNLQSMRMYKIKVV